MKRILCSNVRDGGYELALLVFVEGFLITTLSGDCH